MEKWKENKTLFAITFVVVGLALGMFLSGDNNRGKDFLHRYDGDKNGYMMGGYSEKYGSSGYTVMSDFVSMRPEVESLPTESISSAESAGLLYMREEEKLARDVYITLYKKWGTQIFSNISRSEEVHTNAVKSLLSKYKIADPVTNDEIGVFKNRELADLYKQLTDQGSVSLEEALKVGATIEDLDIKDLNNYIKDTDNQDINLVYNNLKRGSENHMRAFVAQLEAKGGSYTPQYISEEEYTAIIGSNTGRGNRSRSDGWFGRGMMGW